jgi:mannan endo-1,4-beta-mannosidase
MKRILFILFLALAVMQARSQSLITAAEAETGVLSGVTVAGPEGASSGLFVTGFDRARDKVTVTVNVASAGMYNLVMRYRAAFGDKTNDLYVNGAFSSGVVFSASTDFVDLNGIAIVLNAGNNTLEIQKNWGYFDIDKFSIYANVPNTYNITPSLNDNQITSNAQKLYDFVRSQYGQKIMTGQTSDYYDNLVAITGKKPLVRGFDLLTYSPMYAYAWDGGHVFGPVDNGEVNKVISWYNETGKKGVVEIHWHWFSPSGGQAGTNTFYTSETTFDVSRAVVSGTPENIAALRDIDAIAVELKKIRDAGVPVIWRPLHEAGGGWFWWGAKGPGPCLALWDILRDRLTNYHGLHNLIWSWSTPESNWYPGHTKVDMLGFDSYPGANNYTVQKAMFDTYHDLGNGTKIVAMTENGPIPDLGQAIDFDARWSWFCAWNDMVTAENSTQHIIDMYNHPYALTVENCPSYQNASVATPTFNPPTGTYTAPQSVTISTATTGSTIYYTTNGTAPTTSSPVYSSPISISTTTTIRAIATKSGLENSSEGSATFTIAAPVFQVGATYRLTPRHVANKAMEVAGSSLANGALVQQNASSSGDNQKWRFVDGGAGAFKLVAVHSSKALEVSGSSTAEGASVVQWDLVSNQSQRWNIVAVGGGYYKIENLNSGKVLGVDGAKKTNGAVVKQFTYTGANNQQWRVELISAPSGRSATESTFSSELLESNDVSFYPNPAEDHVKIDLTKFKEEVAIELRDMNGKLLHHIRTAGGGTYRLSTTQFQRGFYLIHLEVQGQRLFKKLILK